jgi:hypothetical protein
MLERIPKALICGMLKDEGRILFLTKKDRHGIVRLELPWIYGHTNVNPVGELAEAFLKYTGIEGQVGEIIYETRHNAGSRRRKRWIPCFVFQVTARNRRAEPGGGYTSFRWLSIDGAKKEKLGRQLEWLRKYE